MVADSLTTRSRPQFFATSQAVVILVQYIFFHSCVDFGNVWISFAHSTARGIPSVDSETVWISLVHSTAIITSRDAALAFDYYHYPPSYVLKQVYDRRYQLLLLLVHTTIFVSADQLVFHRSLISWIRIKCGFQSRIQPRRYSLPIVL